MANDVNRLIDMLYERIEDAKSPALKPNMSMVDRDELLDLLDELRAQLPVEGATVVVTQRGTGGKYQLLSVQATDRSGATKPVAISTPALGESTHPGSSVPPYAVCDVWAEHPGYAMLLVEGVQIFQGVETLQSMELEPLNEGQSSLIQNNIREIPGQTL